MTREYCAAWEFIVLAPKQVEFECRYGPDGDWAHLFRQAQGFIRLELLRDLKDPLRYLTLDRWQDEASYRAFHAKFADAYAALDRDCAGLTARETPLGEFGNEGP